MYQDREDAIVRISDGACIPRDSRNADYQEYLRWVAAGNTATPVPMVDLNELSLAELATLFILQNITVDPGSETERLRLIAQLQGRAG